MLLREIFSEPEEQVQIDGSGLSLFLEEKPQKISLKQSIILSSILHVLIFGLFFLLAQILVYILMFLGIDLGLFKRPELKIRDIEFVLVSPEKYNLQKTFVKNASGKNYSLAGPEPNNRPYNDNKGSLKSQVKNKSVAKESVVNKKTTTNKSAASQTNLPASQKPKKGNAVPTIEAPGIFSFNMPKTEMNTDFGFGTQGEAGIHSPNAGNATFKASGEGLMGSGEGDSVGDGTVKGGGYYYGAAGAPRPQSANQYRNEGTDVDLRPYVTELQRRVLRNWSTPSNDNSKKTVLFLRIAKSGNLMILNVKTPSGDVYIDELALNAVKKAQPFNPLPQAYRNAYADIILTFDYNVSARPN